MEVGILICKPIVQLKISYNVTPVDRISGVTVPVEKLINNFGF